MKTTGVLAVFFVMCAVALVPVRSSAYSNVEGGCIACHTKDDLHGIETHLEKCDTCHATPGPVRGDATVTPAKCAMCHPADNPGACNLIVYAPHSSQDCISCHSSCATATCPAAKVLGDTDPRLETLRQFRTKVLVKSALGRKLTALYYTNAAALDAALDRSPALRAFVRTMLELAVPVAAQLM